MKSKSISKQNSEVAYNGEGLFGSENLMYETIIPLTVEPKPQIRSSIKAEILFITSYPPRECGIATYSQDLIKALENKFSGSFAIKVCALESGDQEFIYPDEVKYRLKTSVPDSYEKIASKINNDAKIRIVLIQHEFGFFARQEGAFIQLLNNLTKPVVIVFHTVLPTPDAKLKSDIRSIAAACESIIVMTHNSADILINEYGLPEEMISIIAHGTHLVQHLNKDFLKQKFGLKGRKILTTFGLLSAGKGIETTLKALPAITKTNPDVLFLVIGKTHPEVLKEEGEKYRLSLEEIVKSNHLEQHVKFINSYLALPDLLEYLQLTDIYLFTTKDPNQAVSGTFAYAMSCGCPIISTPIPHAREVLTKDTGIIFDFLDSQQLSEAVILLLNNRPLRHNIRINTLQKIVSTAWENSAVKHTMLFRKIAVDKIPIQYNIPAVNLNHVKMMTTDTGIIQFSRINQPDLCSGYTLDDNARALIAMCMQIDVLHDNKVIRYLGRYLDFIKFCQQPDGNFLNYVDADNRFTPQNKEVNLDDANGRAVWALGFLISQKSKLPLRFRSEAIAMIQKAIPQLESIQSPRAMAFAIKGLYYYYTAVNSPEVLNILKTLADRLVRMYKHESSEKWQWFESYLTYANSILPEAMLYAWLITGETIYKIIANSSLQFLLSIIFNEKGIEVISNRTWLKKGQVAGRFGEQPIDVAYTVMTLSKFYDAFADEDHFIKMETAFNWFLGSNRLHQVIYNPRTGGCYDGLEETHVNLNQGAESTLSYLMARLTIEKYNPEMKKENQVFLFPEEKLTRKKVMGLSSEESLMTIKSYFFIADSSGIIRKKTKRSRTWE